MRRLLWKGSFSWSSCQVGISLGRVELASLRTRPLQPAMGGFVLWRVRRKGKKERFNLSVVNGPFENGGRYEDRREMEMSKTNESPLLARAKKNPFAPSPKSIESTVDPCTPSPSTLLPSIPPSLFYCASQSTHSSTHQPWSIANCSAQKKASCPKGKQCKPHECRIGTREGQWRIDLLRVRIM